jgi:hypothetical protein
MLSILIRFLKFDTQSHFGLSSDSIYLAMVFFGYNVIQIYIKKV